MNKKLSICGIICGIGSLILDIQDDYLSIISIVFDCIIIVGFVCLYIKNRK